MKRSHSVLRPKTVSKNPVFSLARGNKIENRLWTKFLYDSFKNVCFFNKESFEWRFSFIKERIVFKKV